MGGSLTEYPGIAGRVLDHAAEFVDLVARRAPGDYARWLAREDVVALLRGDNAFNQGKLYAWVEYMVFREEFRARFPEATDAACINAFCKLFLKNDISLSNLVEFMKGWLEQGRTDLPPPE